MTRRVTAAGVAVAVAIAGLVGGCVPQVPLNPAPPSVPAVNQAWNEAIDRAKRDPFYAGSYVENGSLWIGFTRHAPATLRAITTQPGIYAFTATHTEAALQSAFRATVAMLTLDQYGPTSANIDVRRGVITVGTANSLQHGGGPTPRCAALPPLPTSAPGTSVQLIDLRDCQK